MNKDVIPARWQLTVCVYAHRVVFGNGTFALQRLMQMLTLVIGVTVVVTKQTNKQTNYNIAIKLFNDFRC